MSHDLKSAFWDRIDKVQAGMLQAGGARPVPMAPYADRDENSIWFITAAGTEIAQAAETGAEASLQIADSSSHLYGSVDGRISMVNDPDKLDEAAFGGSGGVVIGGSSPSFSTMSTSHDRGVHRAVCGDVQGHGTARRYVKVRGHNAKGGGDDLRTRAQVARPAHGLRSCAADAPSYAPGSGLHTRRTGD